MRHSILWQKLNKTRSDHIQELGDYKYGDWIKTCKDVENHSGCKIQFLGSKHCHCCLKCAIARNPNPEISESNLQTLSEDVHRSKTSGLPGLSSTFVSSSLEDNIRMLRKSLKQAETLGNEVVKKIRLKIRPHVEEGNFGIAENIIMEMPDCNQRRTLLLELQNRKKANG